MHEISLDQLEAAIARPSHRPRDGSRLIISELPDPFVAPMLQVLDSDLDQPFSVEAVFVQASAAVGKSVVAQYLSCSRSVPLLNLADVPVSTHSLLGLIEASFPTDANAVDEMEVRHYDMDDMAMGG